MATKQEVPLIVGRFVQGDLFVPQTKNKMGQPLMTQSGQPTQRYMISVAFPKVVNGQPNADFARIWAVVESAARSGFPALGNIIPPWDPASRFSWKIADGDGIDGDGKPNSVKPGFAGHWVVKFSSSFAPKVFYAGRYAPHEQITDSKSVPRGYYVAVSGSVEGNDNPQKPGVYMNLSMVALVGGSPSDIIHSGPDAATVYGQANLQLPAGVAAIQMGAAPTHVQPMAALPGMMPQAQPMGLPGMQPAQPVGGPPMIPGMQMQQPAQPMGLPGMQPAQHAQPLAVHPYPGIVPGMQPAQQVQPMAALPGMMPQAQPMGLPQMQQPRVFAMTAKANGYTREQYNAQGYSDQMLIDNGLMA